MWTINSDYEVREDPQGEWDNKFGALSFALQQAQQRLEVLSAERQEVWIACAKLRKQLAVCKKLEAVLS